MKTLIYILFLVGILNAKALAQDESIPPGMKSYTFVMLTAGPNRSQDSATVAQIQTAHLNHISTMMQTGKLNVAGPFLDDGIWRGILIFNTDDTSMVKDMIDEDPAVLAGRLRYEIHPWMGLKGATLE